MGHGCHDCGSPNSCECPETIAFREKLRVERGEPRYFVRTIAWDLEKLAAQIDAARYDAGYETMEPGEKKLLDKARTAVVKACYGFIDEHES